ncbi:hypothetical protein ScPMuIL_015781 [Solemya velum]
MKRNRREGLVAFPSPRPTPEFFLEERTFSTKKARGTPRDSLPPRPPIKSAPPISRIFPHRPIQHAQVVSFRSVDSNGSLLGVGYENSKDLYFNQCFAKISRIGAGSFGEVYKVRSKEDGKQYAIKRSQERFRGESDRRRKLEEVAKHEKLPPHPNCVRFYRAWEEKQHLYLQTELCKTSLSNLTENQHDIGEMVIWNYMVDLLMAVKHLHDHNLVHMDIKPENIFISYEGVCKLGDFGLVVDLSKSHDMTEAQEGDPKYLAPELMESKFGKSADIFSLGMTILELASDLDLPRGGDGWHMLREGKLPEEFLRGKSFHLKYVIHQMLDPDPKSRPTVDQVLAFPYVRKVWKRRRRDYMMKSVISTVKSILSRLFHWVFFITSMFMYPFRRFRHHSNLSFIHSDSSGMQSQSSGSGLDHSISDDECFENDISIHNNSVGAPLNSSSSSESYGGEFSLPCLPPPRNAYTTPLIRQRPHGYISSPMSSSPVFTKCKSNYSPDSSFNSSFEEDRSVTPTFNVSTQGLNNIGEDDGAKPGIEPKNLMEMFEAASDED